MPTDCEQLLKIDIKTLSDYYRIKKVSPIEITNALLKRIAKINPILNAYITVMEKEVLSSAKQAESEIMKGKWKGFLHGVPIGLKDLIYTKGIRTTMASESHKRFRPSYNGTVVEKLVQHGALITGKLNTHQFAYGPTGDVSFFGTTRNPYDLSKISGGSSSGSGVAVASALCFGALGTDTAGSIRIPSSACGIVGMKPTFGRVSKYGVFPLAYTMDHVGPMTRTVRDNAIILDCLAGYDDKDQYSVNKKEESFTRMLGKGIQGKIIGIPMNFYYENIENEVRKAIEDAIQLFQSLGAKIVEVDLEFPNVFWGQFLTIRSEAHAVYKESLEGRDGKLYPEVRKRFLEGEKIRGWEYVNAQKIRYQAVQSFNRVFEHVEALITPTLPILPPNIGEEEIDIQDHRELVYSALLRLTGPTNLTGLPSLSLPCGFSNSGLPIGMQIIGKPFSEANLYQIAYAFEKEKSLNTLKWDL